MDEGKITSIPNIDRDKARAALETLKRNVEIICETSVVLARIRRASYEAHLAQGFTPAEALELCKATF